MPLDWTRLKPFAIARGRDVLALAVDPFVSGHRYLLDAVLCRDGTAVLYPERRLWFGENGVLALVPERGDGPAIALRPSGLTLAKRQPFADPIRRATGIARGQARLHQLIFAGTPYAAALDRAVSR